MVVLPAPLHYRALQALKHETVKQDRYSNVAILLDATCQDLQWYHQEVVNSQQ